MAGIALLAGGGALTALRLGVSMTLLQFAIGTLNDIADAPLDADRTPPKAIPSGLVTPRQAGLVAAVAAIAGVGLAIPGGAGLVGLALLVLAIGAAYDLVAKGTAWSWLPFAVGIPILPIYGWFGAAGSLPDAFRVLVPMAAIAGAALAIANARADLDADMRAGSRSVSTALGPVNSWWLNVGLMGAASAIGFISAGPPGPGILWSSVLFGTIVVAAALGRARTADSATWRGAWQLQAIGVAFAGVGWAGLLLA